MFFVFVLFVDVFGVFEYLWVLDLFVFLNVYLKTRSLFLFGCIPFVLQKFPWFSGAVDSIIFFGQLGRRLQAKLVW